MSGYYRAETEVLAPCAVSTDATVVVASLVLHEMVQVPKRTLLSVSFDKLPSEEKEGYLLIAKWGGSPGTLFVLY